MSKTLLILAISALALAGCKRSSGDPPKPTAPAASKKQLTTTATADDQRLARAREVIGQLKKNLKAALMAAVPKGPVKAIGLCSTEAPEIRAKVNTEGVKVGRSSHKLRNPDNAPPDWLKPLMAQLRAAPAKKGDHRATELPGGGLGYAEAIHVGPVCLTCHGSSIPAAVVAELRERYPADRATGFALDDYRGVFWAEVRPPAR